MHGLARLLHPRSIAAVGGRPAAEVIRQCRRLGVAQVHSVPALLETLKLLHFAGPLPGRAIASMSCSGGEAALIADRAAGRRVAFRDFSPAERASVTATVPPLVTLSSPFDYHIFSWANRAALEAVFGVVLGCGFALTALIPDYPREDRCDAADWQVAADALVAARRRRQWRQPRRSGFRSR